MPVTTSQIEKKQFAGMNQHYKRFPLEYFLDAQQRVGFQNIELWLGVPHFWLDSISYDDCKVVRKKVKDRGLQVVSVTSPSLGYQYQYSPREESHRERSFKYFSNGIRVTAELGAGIMTVNSGWGYLNGDFQEAFERSKAMISRLCDVAASEGVLLALESLTSLESNIVNDITTTRRMFDEIHHPALKIMIDTVATGFAGETTTQWFEVFGRDVVHMHFVDGDRRTAAHVIWGDGTYPLQEELQRLRDSGYTGYLVQEIDDARYFGDPVSADLENMRRISGCVRN
jgi:protein FrlC